MDPFTKRHNLLSQFGSKSVSEPALCDTQQCCTFFSAEKVFYPGFFVLFLVIGTQWVYPLPKTRPQSLNWRERESCYPRCHNFGSENQAFSDFMEITQFCIQNIPPFICFGLGYIFHPISPIQVDKFPLFFYLMCYK